MVRGKQFWVWGLVIIVVSALNLSSACRHDPPTNISPETRNELGEDPVATTEAKTSDNVVVLGEDEELTEPDHSQGGAGLEAVTAVDELNIQIENSDDLMELSWKALTDVEFKDVYVEELDAYYWKPTFGQSVLDLEGKEVFITGYIIPVDYDENFYVLSRYPFANCFFCGGAGPESVVDLRFKSENRIYKTDERLTFRGTLGLNADDVYQMNYILNEAEEYD